MKAYKINAADFQPLATGHGACFATDMITVEGHAVGYCYREAPDNEIDSGWRFLSGLESDEYMDDSDNLAIYDVNTIANYDPAIVALLGAPVGSAFERGSDGEHFVPVDFEPVED
ncbi:DUF2185 domain-containing protein [Dyella silvatica]|uniref:DUF2185 domain-containing protein n=1 Tax=Dyella silvatica TaxID=2992128 RepID=UPI002251658E|nr:DUF2185 domain-containing protein [Dyella silvatica]